MIQICPVEVKMLYVQGFPERLCGLRKMLSWKRFNIINDIDFSDEMQFSLLSFNYQKMYTRLFCY